MDFLQEYEKQKKIDAIVWMSLPTILGYWIWFAVTIYCWRFRLIGLDLSATFGLGIGIATWMLSHLILGALGVGLIHTNLWENCGCGCLAKIIAIPLMPYAGIFGLIIWAHISGALGMSESIISLMVGLADWFLLTYLDT